MMMWDEWFLHDLNTPDKQTYYEMQTALEVRRSRIKDPSKAQLKHMRLPFKRQRVRTKAEIKADKEEATKAAIKSDIEGMISKVGGAGKVTRVTISRKEHEAQQRKAQEEYEERQRKKGKSQ